MINSDLEDLPDVVAGHSLAVHEPRRCSLDDLKAEVSTRHKLEHHVEHALASETGNAVNQFQTLIQAATWSRSPGARQCADV